MAIWRAVLIFVAGEHGISHTLHEYANPQACANGTSLLGNADRRAPRRRAG